VEKPRWFKTVLRAVGVLMGEGEMGIGKGDLGPPWVAATEGTARESLGFAARSIVTVWKERLWIE